MYDYLIPSPCKESLKNIGKQSSILDWAFVLEISQKRDDLELLISIIRFCFLTFNLIYPLYLVVTFSAYFNLFWVFFWCTGNACFRNQVIKNHTLLEYLHINASLCNYVDMHWMKVAIILSIEIILMKNKNILAFMLAFFSST